MYCHSYTAKICVFLDCLPAYLLHMDFCTVTYFTKFSDAVLPLVEIPIMILQDVTRFCKVLFQNFTSCKITRSRQDVSNYCEIITEILPTWTLAKDMTENSYYSVTQVLMLIAPDKFTSFMRVTS